MGGSTGEVGSFFPDYVREKARADKAEAELALLRGVTASPGAGDSPQLGGALAPGGARSPAQDALERALSLAPDNSFVRSCATYLQANGRLSPKQIASLGRIRPETPTDLRRVASTLTAFLDDEEADHWIGADELFGGPH